MVEQKTVWGGRGLAWQAAAWWQQGRRHGGTKQQPPSWPHTCRRPRALQRLQRTQSRQRRRPQWRPARRRRCRCQRRQSGRGRRAFQRCLRRRRRWRCLRQRCRWGPGSLRWAGACSLLHPPLTTLESRPPAAGGRAPWHGCRLHGRLLLPGAAGRRAGERRVPSCSRGNGQLAGERQASTAGRNQGWKLATHAGTAAIACHVSAAQCAAADRLRVTCYRQCQLRPLGGAGRSRRVPAWLRPPPPSGKGMGEQEGAGQSQQTKAGRSGQERGRKTGAPGATVLHRHGGSTCCLRGSAALNGGSWRRGRGEACLSKTGGYVCVRVKGGCKASDAASKPNGVGWEVGAGRQMRAAGRPRGTGGTRLGQPSTVQLYTAAGSPSQPAAQPRLPPPPLTEAAQSSVRVVHVVVVFVRVEHARNLGQLLPLRLGLGGKLRKNGEGFARFGACPRHCLAPWPASAVPPQLAKQRVGTCKQSDCAHRLSGCWHGGLPGRGLRMHARPHGTLHHCKQPRHPTCTVASSVKQGIYSQCNRAPADPQTHEHKEPASGNAAHLRRHLLRKEVCVVLVRELVGLQKAGRAGRK